MTDDQLRHLAHRLTAFDAKAAIIAGLRGERAFFSDVVQRVYTDDGNGNGRLTADGLAALNSLQSQVGAEPTPETRLFGPIAATILADRKSMLREFNQRFDMLTAGDLQHYDEVETFDGLDRYRYWPIRLMLPAWSSSIGRARRTAQWRDAILTAIALELYHRHHAVYPDSLTELVPDLLPTIPVDMFSNQPVRYVLRDGRPLLYSVGTNGIDDGGTLGTSKPDPNHGAATSRYADGDWILYPRPHDPPDNN
jgi:hypothetical protein